MLRFICFFSVFLYVFGDEMTASAQSAQKVDHGGSSQQPARLKIDMPQWGKYSIPEQSESEASFNNQRTKNYDVASNPKNFEPRDNISVHPLMPAREQKQLFKSR